MSRLPALFAAFALAALPHAVTAQPVEVVALAAPDAFSTAGRDTGLPQGLWRGASLQTVRTVLPLLASKPLSPATQALARRLVATGAPGPQGAGADPDLAAARANALVGLGDPRAAATILARTPSLDRSEELSRAAAETALLAGDDARACAIAEALTIGRDGTYWLRLRTYCQALAGNTAQAQLTFELAQAQAKDAVFARLMAAKLAGAGNPGAPSLRNVLDYALSRSLGLDLATAKPSAGVAAALAGADPQALTWALPAGESPVAAVAGALAAGQAIPPGSLDRLIEAAGAADAKTRPAAQGAALLTAALAGPLTAEQRAALAAFTLAEGKAPAGRNLALETAAGEKLMGETALLVLWTSADAGAAGPAIGDRVRIVRALQLVGLEAEARAFALEGLLGVK
jgi:hypothetical protein